MDPGELTADDRRRHRIADCLLKSLERCGSAVSTTNRGLLVADVDRSKVEFDLREKMKQIRRPLTQKEREWETWNTSGVKQELVPTGCLLLSIKNYLDGSLRREWLETPQRSMEAQIPEILATIILAGGIIGERRRKAEAAAAEFEAQRRQREEERARQRQDDERWSRFIGAALRWREMADIRIFLGALKALPMDSSALIEGRTVVAWIDWAEQRLILGDPLRSGVGPFFDEIVTRNQPRAAFMP